MTDYELSEYDADQLIGSRATADYFEKTALALRNPGAEPDAARELRPELLPRKSPTGSSATSPAS